MGSIVLYMSMSLDGLITGPGDRPGQGLGLNRSRVFRWLEERNTPGPNKDVFDELMATGAVLAGRRTLVFHNYSSTRTRTWRTVDVGSDS